MEPKSQEICIIIKAESKKVEDYHEPHLEEFRKEVETVDLTKVTFVNLSGNSYAPAFHEKMSEHLAKMTALERLNVNDNFVSRDKEQIPKSILHLFGSISSTLHSIDLSNNAMGPHGAGAFAEYLARGPQLRVLLINNCGLGAGGLKILSEALLKGKISLETLSIGRNRMEDDGCVALSSALKEMPKLKDLRVFQNFIREKGMTTLLETLNAACPLIEILDVNDNFIKTDATKLLADFIRIHKNLKVLNVSDCNIEPEDVPTIIKALEETDAAIEKIGFNYNNLEESGEAKRFLDAVLKKDHKNLQRLDIKGNEFKKSTKGYYTEKFEALQLDTKNILSAFEDDDDEEEIIREFAELKI